MVYKIGNVKDVENIPISDKITKEVLLKYADILTCEYGYDRDIDYEYGGYIIYAPSGTNIAEVKKIFNYKEYEPEFIDYLPEANQPIYVAVYVTSCEYGVVIVMSESDAPEEFKNFVNCSNEAKTEEDSNDN